MPLRHTYVSHTCTHSVRTVSLAVTVTHPSHRPSHGHTLTCPTLEVQGTVLGPLPYSCLSGVPGLGMTPDCPTILHSLAVGISLVTVTSPVGSTLCVLSPFVEQVTQVGDPVRPTPTFQGPGPASSRAHGAWAGLQVCQPELTQLLQARPWAGHGGQSPASGPQELPQETSGPPPPHRTAKPRYVPSWY